MDIKLSLWDKWEGEGKIMDRKLAIILTITFFMLWLVGLVILLILGMTKFMEPYTLNLDGGNCSIGKPEIAGDYKVKPDNLNPLNSGDERACAIKDCAEFNHYQKLVGSKELCVV